jgi:DNA-directed RNA polymerase subunit H (RpoH/RPB5)
MVKNYYNKNNMKLEIIKEMMAQRNFREHKIREGYMIGVNDNNQFIYIKIFNGKFELNTVREFLSSKFIVDSSGKIEMMRTSKDLVEVIQLVIVCKSFQNSHVKEFKEVSKHIQLIKGDFFNINITKKAPLHQKVNSEDVTMGQCVRNKKEIAIIKEDDPNCIFYNFVKGDVIRVVRVDGEIYYRLVR